MVWVGYKCYPKLKIYIYVQINWNRSICTQTLRMCMWLVNETFKEEEDEGRISVKTVALWWFDRVQPWKCSSSVNTSIICCIFLTTARTDWARGREQGENRRMMWQRSHNLLLLREETVKLETLLETRGREKKRSKTVRHVPPWREQSEETKD